MTQSQNHYKNIVGDLGIASGQTIAVIGSGGKTTLMLGLAEALRNRYKVLITTTTRIYEPIGDEYQVDIEMPEVYLSELITRQLSFQKTYVYGSDAMPCLDIHDREQVKISGFSKLELEENSGILHEAFDIVIIEADGSRNRPFKAWKMDEPIVPCTASMTIGVIGVHKLGAPIDEKNVHRRDLFELFFCNEGDSKPEYVTQEVVLRSIQSDHGIFSKAQGQKVLYLPGASDDLSDWFKEKLHGEDIWIIH